MPALFLGHGNPMNAVTDNPFREQWLALGRSLPRPEAILCISAHWETRGIAVTGHAQPATIHDFRGFPQQLFDVQYPAPGDPALANRVAALLANEQVTLDPERGFDHGAWAVLSSLYPDADIPVIQLSLDSAKPGHWHFGIGKKLASLRDEGILLIGSGNLVHNLRLFDYHATQAADWAARAQETLNSLLDRRAFDELCDFRSLNPDVQLGIPTAEHYLPLLYVLGAMQAEESITRFNDTVISAISMTSLLVR